MMNARNLFYPESKKVSDAEKKAFAREKLVYNVTEDLLVFLEDMNINKKELARRLGKSKSYVTQILSGSRNMTLGSFSDICFVLGFEPEIKVPSTQKREEYREALELKWETFDSVNAQIDYTRVKIRSNILEKKNPENWVRAA